MGGLPLHCGVETSVFPLHQHIDETDLVVVFFLSGELYLGMLFIQVCVKLLKLLDAMRPKGEGVVDISDPHLWRRGCKGECLAFSKASMKRLAMMGREGISSLPCLPFRRTGLRTRSR